MNLELMGMEELIEQESMILDGGKTMTTIPPLRIHMYGLSEDGRVVHIGDHIIKY